MGDGDLREKQGTDGLWTRSRLLVPVLFICTAILFYLCCLLARPFLPALAWGLALAILADPIHQWIGKRTRHEPLAAGLSVLLVAFILVLPAWFVVRTIVQQATASVEAVSSGTLQRQFDSLLEKAPTLARFWHWIEAQMNGELSPDQLAGALGKWIPGFLTGSAYGTISLLIAFFLLFYFLRDRDLMIDFVRSLLPVSDHEADQVLNRVRDTVFATIYGTLAVASVQGSLGGLMFWWLGLPAPALWGMVMGLLSIIPVLGAFVIWIPAALFLAMQENWGKAIVLTVWGTVVIGLIDNLLYPILVGKRLSLHTVPVFIAIVGGLMVFGASGIVIGPLILSLTDAAINVWRCRTARGRSAARQSP
jgi:predicted PurR-regulated permease PerM